MLRNRPAHRRARPAGRLGSRRDDGAAAVEFALVSVLLLLLLFGIIGFGFALFRQQAASHAAREGARLAAVGVGTGRSVTTCAEFTDEVSDRAEGATVTSVTLAVSEASGNSALGTGDVVTVSVTHTVDLSLLGALVPGIPASLELTQTGKARVEVLGSVTECD